MELDKIEDSLNSNEMEGQDLIPEERIEERRPKRMYKYLSSAELEELRTIFLQEADSDKRDKFTLKALAVKYGVSVSNITKLKARFY